MTKPKRNPYLMTPDNIKGIMEHRLIYNPGAISLPILGIPIGAGHTAFAGDKVWSDTMIWKHPLTIVGWADGPAVPRTWKVLLVEEHDGMERPEELFPSLLLAAISARKRVARLYRSRRKWMKIYREGVRDIDAIIEMEKYRLAQ